MDDHQEIKSRFRSLVETRHARDEAKKAYEKAEEDYREVEAEIIAYLDASPIEGTIKIDVGEPYGVVSFRGNQTYYGRLLDEDQALEYYEQRAMVDEVTKPKFVMARLNEEVRQRLETGESMPPGVDYYTRRYVTISMPK
jgi:hypothetical protein